MNFIEIARAGVIDEAPTFAEIGLKVLNFLLSVAGILAVIGFVVSGLLYFAAIGDEKKMQLAKKAFTFSIYGTVVVLSSLVIITLITSFL